MIYKGGEAMDGQDEGGWVRDKGVGVSDEEGEVRDE